jgi:NodT family efflux transporter outer membrane factor (OMF) lipoprotein
MNPSERQTSRWFAKALVLVGLIAVAPLAGCEATEHATKSDEVVEIPDAYDGLVVEGPELERWCTDFDSPELEQLVEVSFTQNLEVRAAFARIRQARAIADQQQASLWPWLSAEGSVTQQRTDIGSQFGADLPTGGAAQEPEFFSIEDSFTTYRGSLAASYEIDVWGRIRSQWEAARLEAAAARAQAESLAITLTSQIAENWLELVYQRERIALIEEQIETSERFYELTLLRLSQGTATALDVTQQKQNLESLRGQLSLARSAAATAQNQVAVLVGEPPQEELGLDRQELPDLAPIPATGVPADLLERRPDVRAAMLQVRAADQRVEAAVAERLPSVQLSANLSVQATEIAQLFDQLLFSLGASLSQPIFQGGRLSAQIEQREAVAEEALYNYAQTLLTALREVQDALIREQYQQEFVESLQTQLESAERALELARDRYRLGALEYLRVLDSIQALQQTQQNLLDARRQQLSTRVGLCRALGGTWTRQLEAPEGVQQ